MSAHPLRADEAAELSEILEFTADALDENGQFLAAAGMDPTELRLTLLSWSLRLLDTPANAGFE
jgi:hypothetical protein